MKVFQLLLMLAFLLVGLIIGALNSQPILIDFAFASLATTSGVAIIVSLLAGVLIGGVLVLAVMVLPLYSKLRQANKQLAAARVAAPVVVEPRPIDGI
ncbi:LapA family protein [Stenotrophomonas sp. HITSZ_GD]|uniref:LapA family protein n=1 Tax=Stenotrophomonas sp. HITSZ_GD TaxID=3037248 RepID=UPI00240D6955|nr:LapA family protein [Stenotrophomonas sp. HITSZ_GD]MDG2524329.1 LapA family protein [Stenotrophomonas sp. HITSZ_GD]